jgi:tyrosine-protein phosphatase 2/3
VDANSEFEAFRKQTEASGTFSLGHGNLSYFSSTPGPIPIRRRSDEGVTTDDPAAVPPTGGDVSPIQKDPPDRSVERGPGHGLPTAKLQVEAPRSTPSYFDMPRQGSPSTINPAATPRRPEPRNVLSYLDDRHPRLSLPSNRADPLLPNVDQEIRQRADTLPLTLEDGPVMIKAAELKDILQSVAIQDFLLLDLRISLQFSQFRIKGALNLCIPTTLLKRPSFNLEKLKDTFRDEKEKARFSQWRDCRYIIVYDAHSREKKDATSALNTLKKFAIEGWNGRAYILRGGISEFSRAYPQLVEQHPGKEIQSSRKLSLDSSMAGIAPIAGGCAMPSVQSAANPFFGNIRQNMDLVGGVGQMDVTRPEALGPEADGFLPRWLREAAAPADRGKIVAEKFLRIEQDELSRMQRALSSRASCGTPESGSKRSVQIAGFEKGGKNRYNNIWPFEHARVRLQGRPEGACDYVNASHIKAAWSNKRYIASQGPLPATFEVSLGASPQIEKG